MLINKQALMAVLIILFLFFLVPVLVFTNEPYGNLTMIITLGVLKYQELTLKVLIAFVIRWSYPSNDGKKFVKRVVNINQEFDLFVIG
jgi:hypothetical protein